MKKNLMFGSAIVAMLLLGTGCGGGSSSSSDDSTSAEASVSTEKTGYYLDSAVGGASYSCVSTGSSSNGDGTASDEDSTDNGDGTTSDEDSTDNGDGTTSDEDSTDNGDGTTSDEDNSDDEDGTASDDDSSTEKSTRSIQKGEGLTTGADGSFSFKDGQVCTFSVGGVVLRTLDTTGLADKGIVLEDNIVVARFLQTLDNDNNPANGISIDPAVSQSIATEMGETIPSTDEALSELVSGLQEKVDTYKGEMVTEEEAESHLAETKTFVDSMNGLMGTLTGDSSSEEGEGEGTSTGSSDGSNSNGGSSNMPLGNMGGDSNADEDGSNTDGGMDNPLGSMGGDSSSDKDDSTTSGSTDTPAGSGGGTGSASGSNTTPASPATPTAPTSPSTPSIGGF